MSALMKSSPVPIHLILALVFLQCVVPLASADDAKLTIVTDCCEHVYNVELALTGDQRAVGLMNRSEMADDSGMLFRFDRVQPAMMWMKNTLIPLDMIFIRENGTVADIHHNAVPLSETVIVSSEPVLYVLELNGGVADRIGLNRGDRVHHPVIDGR